VYGAPTSEESSKEGRRMCQLILLVTPSIQCDEDAFVEISGYDLDTGSGELGTELIESTS